MQPASQNRMTKAVKVSWKNSTLRTRLSLQFSGFVLSQMRSVVSAWTPVMVAAASNTNAGTQIFFCSSASAVKPDTAVKATWA